MSEPTAGRRAVPARLLAYLCAAPLFLMVGLTFFDVFARYLFSKPIPGSTELVQFAMALTIFAALPLVTRERQHVSVSLVEGLLTGRLRRLQQLFVDAASLLACALIAWQLGLIARDFVRSGTRTIVNEIPMAPLAGAMCLFAVATCGVIAVQLWRDLNR